MSAVNLRYQRQAIARQRFVDRLRAAEDVRVATLAVRKANEARQKAIRDNVTIKEAATAVAAAKQKQTEEMQKAVNGLSDLSATVIGQVVNDTVAMMKKAQLRDEARKAAEALKVEGEISAAAASLATTEAKKAQARLAAAQTSQKVLYNEGEAEKVAASAAYQNGMQAKAVYKQQEANAQGAYQAMRDDEAAVTNEVVGQVNVAKDAAIG